MEDNSGEIPAHPQGEIERRGERDVIDQSKAVETFGGKVFVRWDPDAAVTALSSQDKRTVAAIGKRVPAEPQQPECSVQGRYPAEPFC